MLKNEFNNLAMDFNETSKHIAEMKSIQPYSTKNEYIYAMKEDLSDWFNSMYDTSLNAHNFIDQLRNGVLICEHANNVMREAAFKSFAFNLYDLHQAGIINISNLTVVNNGNNNNNNTSNKKGLINKNFNNFRSNTPNTIKSNGGQSSFAGEYLMYNQEPKMIMIAYDNITNFIKWCRHIVKVKECLMFETEDLTLCKNEKNFILCLLEVARFGSKFGIRVPTIIQLEQEIEAEIEMDKNVNMFKTEDNNNLISKNRFIEEKQPNKEYIKSLGQNDDLNKSPSPSPPPQNYSRSIELNDSSFSLSLSNSASIDKLKDEESPSSSSPSSPSPNNASSRSSSPKQFLKEESDPKINSDLFSPSGSLSSPVSSLTSLTASINQIRDIDLTTDSNGNKNEYLDRLEQFISPINERTSHLPKPIIKTNNNNNTQNQKLSSEKINVQSLIPNKPDKKSTTTAFTKNRINSSSNSSIENLTENNKPILNDSATITITTQVNLHKHVCSIANKCTCEKKFLVDKIGEGKYRIGNTKNIVFIRILKNHIMVRVGGGWDTLENYLDKHDPCRCSSSDTSSLNKRYMNETKYAEHSNQSNNIILTPVRPTTILNSSNSSSGINNINSNNNNSNNSNNNKGVIRVTTISCNNNNNSIKSSPPNTSDSTPIIKSKSNSNINYLSYEPDTNRAVDFTDAHLIIERDQQGKHQIGKILLTQQQHQQQLDGDSSFDINNKIVNKKIEKLKEQEEKEEDNNNNNNNNNNNITTMHSAKNIYFLNALKHATQQKQQPNDEQKSNHHFNDNNSPSTYSSIHFNGRAPPPLPPSSIINSDSIYSSSLISFSNATNKTESMIKNKMKKLINKIPNSSSSSSSSKQSSSPSFSIGLRKSTSTTTTTSTDISTINTPLQSNTNSPVNYRKIEHSTTGLLKFTRTNYSDKIPKMIDNNSDSNNLLADTPVYTDTKLPPRILRKYQKERSITEASIVPLINQETSNDIECSSSSCGSTNGTVSQENNNNKHVDDALIHGPSSSSHCSETSTSTSSSSYTDSNNIKNSVVTADELMIPATNSNLKQNSLSPKITFKSTRTKIKKYKKSKTTDLSRFQEEEQDEDYINKQQNSNTSSDLINSDFDSLESDDNGINNKYLLKLAPTQLNKIQIIENKDDEEEELNDSLELITNEKEIPEDSLIIDENRLEDDSLIINEYKNSNNNNNYNYEKNEKSKTNRAQWDKSRQKIDLMYFNFSKLTENKMNTTNKQLSSNVNNINNNHNTDQSINNKIAYNRSLSSNNANNASSNTLPNPKNKRTKNLNLAKEKLYEMKKTIDAKVNLDSVNRATKSTSSSSLMPKSSGLTSNQLNRITPKATIVAPPPVSSLNTTNNTRTTPRKVKKRSGERSLTTGIILSENILNNNNKSLANSRSNDLANLRASNICASSTSISSVCTSVVSVNTNNNNNNSYAKIQENRLRSRTPNHLNSNNNNNKIHNKTSSSMHNISNFNASSNDESIMNETNVCYGNRKRHDSISSTASSFFGNASSIAANEYKENKAYELRKKSNLMNKITIKNQQQDPIYTRSHPISTKLVDENIDLTSIAIGCLGSYEQKHSAARKRLFAKKNEKTGYDPNMSIGSNGSSNTSTSNTTAKQIIAFNSVAPPQPPARQSRPSTCTTKKTITPRSKSNNDLYYELERTNSAQDLIELLNNCDAPAGDLNQYKVMLSECDKLQFHINKLKSEHKMRKSCTNNNNINSSTNKVVSIKKSPTNVQISNKTVSKPIKNNIKKQNDLNSIKTIQNEALTIEMKNENDSIDSNLMMNSMHRRSHSLPSYIAIPVVESKFKNMQ